MKCTVIMKISQTVLSLLVFLVLTSDENGCRIASTIKGKKCYWFTLIYFGTKRTVTSITLQSYLFVCFRVNSVHWFKIERCHIKVYTFGKELNETDDFHSPCIRLARGKFELTNQDSAGGKNFTVLMSM